MKINWKVRLKNPIWWAEVAMAVVLPMLTALGMGFDDITTWGELLTVLKTSMTNPVIVVAVLTSVWNTVIDPTTKGICDSDRAMTYNEPKGNEVESDD